MPPKAEILEEKRLKNDMIEVSVVMPCLNEEETIASCINKANRAMLDNNIKGEIIVSDNGSTDKSVEIARISGARVVIQKEKGYGNAYKLGIAEAKGGFIIIGDSDDTYNFLEIMKFIRPLREGYQFVNGSRLKGKIHKGAMPLMHQYFGNPLLSFILNLFFKSGFSDAYCGMKAFTKEAYSRIQPRSPGMEFALELQVNASRHELKRTEVPIELHPRKGESKLRTFKDGWRSLRFMLLYCPNYLFLIPGFAIFFAGAIGTLLLLNGPVKILGHIYDFHAMIFFAMATLLGIQIVSLGFFAKSYALSEGFERKNSFFRSFYRYFNLEKGILAGLALILAGLTVSFMIMRNWVIFGPLMQERRLLIAGVLVIMGVQIIFSSFLISLVGMKDSRV